MPETIAFEDTGLPAHLELKMAFQILLACHAENLEQGNVDPIVAAIKRVQILETLEISYDPNLMAAALLYTAAYGDNKKEYSRTPASIKAIIADASVARPKTIKGIALLLAETIQQLQQWNAHWKNLTPPTLEDNEDDIIRRMGYSSTPWDSLRESEQILHSLAEHYQSLISQKGMGLIVETLQTAQLIIDSQPENTVELPRLEA